MSALSLEEFFSSSEALKFLRDNLDTNLEVFCGDLEPGDFDGLRRTNLIMIRQCLEQLGASPKHPSRSRGEM